MKQTFLGSKIRGSGVRGEAMILPGPSKCGCKKKTDRCMDEGSLSQLFFRPPSQIPIQPDGELVVFIFILLHRYAGLKGNFNLCVCGWGGGRLVRDTETDMTVDKRVQRGKGASVGGGP